jgi:phenylalanine-4-hydroxylase
MLPEGHPGFADSAYRARRDKIASIADSYQRGDLITEVPYAPEEHDVWKQVSHILQALYPHFACTEYNECFENFELSEVLIPQLPAVNKNLFDYHFSLLPVAGLVPPREFLEELADGRMFCTQYIRHHSMPEYTPEPDVVHEIFGHAVFFLNEGMRKVSRLFGETARRVDDYAMEELIRLYWHTVEFGVCLEGEEENIKAYGAGLLSSIGELSSICQVPLRNFDIEEMKGTSYDTMNPQPFLFCAESYDHAIDELTNCLERW